MKVGIIRNICKKLQNHSNFMKKISILGFAIFALLTACNNTNQEEQKTQPEKQYKKTLLVIGDDRSGSTFGIRKLTAEDYKMLLTEISKQGGGTVAVALIGNPEPQSWEPFILKIPELSDTTWFDTEDRDITMTERTQILNSNKKIIQENENKLISAQNLINQFVDSIIMPKVINYKPNGPDMTNLDESIKRINILLRTPIFSDYDKIIIAIFSDGKNQPLNKEKPISNTIESPDALVYLIGWNENTDCFKVGSVITLSSKEIFMDEFNNNIKKE